MYEGDAKRGVCVCVCVRVHMRVCVPQAYCLCSGLTVDFSTESLFLNFLAVWHLSSPAESAES